MWRQGGDLHMDLKASAYAWM